jgi:uncharacterized membrane-anchored protein
MRLPEEFEQRQRLANELHARPFANVDTPGAVLSVATLRSDAAGDALCLEHLARLAPNVESARPDTTHLSLRVGGLHVRWERHTEFYGFTFIADTAPTELGSCFDDAWLAALPPGWLAALPGRMIAATRVALLPSPDEPPHARDVAPVFGGELLVGNRVGDGAATVVTDWRSVGGVTRFLVFDHSLNRRRAGRVVQRLLELDTYRMMALLSLPVASQRMAALAAEEAQLASLMDRFRAASDGDERLLAELSDLAARVEHAMANHGARFSATRAYAAIVDQRLAELREGVVTGLQPLSQFLDRRFRPAMDSSAAAWARQAQLSERIARAAQLLQTRSEVERERQNQALLASLDRRQGLQLRLQETVEGLSVLAMTYYGVGLGGYLLKPLAHALGIADSLVTMVAVPVIGLLVLVNLRKLRRRLRREERDPAV